MTLITFPPAVRTYLLDHPALVTQSVSSGPGLDGREQFVHRRASIWRAEVYVRAPRTAAGYGAYMAFLDQLRGPVNSFTVVPCNSLAPTVGIGGAGEVFVDEDGDVLMSNSTTALLLDANPTLDGDHGAGATVLTLSGSDALMLQVGALLTIGRYLYRLVARDGLGITIEPGLRRAEAGGATVRASALQWEVRLASDQAALDARRPVSGRSTFRMDVVESFDR